MAKPLYYGSSKSSGPMYYGAGGGSYGASAPAYYGRQYGGQYGGAPYYGGSQGGGGEGVVGSLSIGRILRVISQRWLSIFVFLLVGLIVSFAIYSISPTIYEAVSEFSMDTRQSNRRGSSAIEQAMIDYGSNYAEIFNTRLSQWRSDIILKKITDNYRSKFPTSTVTDGELISALAGSKLELQKNSRIINISVRSKIPETAMALANAYAMAIEAFTDEENKARCDKAVSQIHEQVEKYRRRKDDLAKNLLEFRTANKIDSLNSHAETVKQALAKATADILALETTEANLVEWQKILAEVQKNPERFGTLPTNTQRAGEITAEHAAFQKLTAEYNGLLVNYTENHPEVVSKAAQLKAAKESFLSATARAYETGASTLNVTRSQLAKLRQKQEELRAEQLSVGQKIATAETSLGTLESEYKIASEVFQTLVLDEQKARMQAEQDNEIVVIGRPAKLPTVPVLPNPPVIFGIGIFAALALGVFFVLVLDNLEDTVVNLSDIEGRLALKVLAVFPHVRRKMREHVAKFLTEEKYSQFSEAVAGLRNLLDSPRYESMNKCMLVISTQPGEGKTITSTSIAISYAQTGRKTLHVDFDLRRPRVAKIWDVKLTEDRSFSHVLQKAGASVPDFAKLVNKTTVEGLDVICSLPPEGVSPASIFGSSVVQEFFAWARANYDRIIVDSPPFGLVGDVVSLATLVDSVLIMCCPDRTHFRPIQFCSRSLTEAGANILGVIVNDVDTTNASAFSQSHKNRYAYKGKYGYGGYGGYGYGGYGYGGYGYGYGYGYGPKKRKDKKESGAAGGSSTEDESPFENPENETPPQPLDEKGKKTESENVADGE